MAFVLQLRGEKSSRWAEMPKDILEMVMLKIYAFDVSYAYPSLKELTLTEQCITLGGVCYQIYMRDVEPCPQRIFDFLSSHRLKSLYLLRCNQSAPQDEALMEADYSYIVDLLHSWKQEFLRLHRYPPTTPESDLNVGFPGAPRSTGSRG